MRYGSCKLSSEIIDKILNNHLITAKQIDIILWLTKRQDEFGKIFYVKYNEVCKDVNISYQEYYDCIYKLEEEGFIFISYRHNSRGWDIEIINNIFASKEHDKKRYLNVNYDFLYEPIFLKMRANEKKLVLKILLNFNFTNKNNYYIYPKTITEWIGINNQQLINSYVKKLQSIFSIMFKSKNKKSTPLYIIKVKECRISQSIKPIIDHYLRHKLSHMLRIFKIKYTEEELLDLIDIVKQRKEYYGILFDTILETLEKTKKVLPKYINKIISLKIEKLHPQI